MEPALFCNALCGSSAPLWPHILGPAAANSPQRGRCWFTCLFFCLFVLTQDRATFRRLILKNNAKKRRMYETFIESVALLKSLEVRSAFCWFADLFIFYFLPLILFQIFKKKEKRNRFIINSTSTLLEACV